MINGIKYIFVIFIFVILFYQILLKESSFFFNHKKCGEINITILFFNSIVKGNNNVTEPESEGTINRNIAALKSIFGILLNECVFH